MHLQNYLLWSGNRSDILLFDLRIGFIENFQFYLKAEKALSINSSGKHVKNLKKIVRDCVDKDWLDKDPFWRYKVKHTDPKVPHLSAEELQRIEQKVIPMPRLALVRDIFLFSCYSGFAYADVAALKQEHIKIGVNGKRWLIKPRQKTGIIELVPIFPPVESILTKYNGHSKWEKPGMLLPVPSNQKVNAYLKELGDLCSIPFNLTFHMARHTFASTVALDNGVPIDSVSKMLGHRSIKTTQIYARVSQEKVAADTLRLYTSRN
ncbi:MAG: site-specific integrase [Chitinophagaceae bacterium]